MKASLLALAATFGLAAPAMAQDLYFTIINQSPRALISFYATPTHVNNWGYDLMGAQVLEIGESGRVWIADNQKTCIYDVRFVLEGDYEVEGVQNICDLGQFVLR